MYNGGQDFIESKGTPDFSKIATTDEGMFATSDDYGTSYYFRGDIDNNWLSFAGYYWRIIRINGNGSIRLIYNGSTTNQTGSDTQILSNIPFNNYQNDNAYVGYMYDFNLVHGLTESSNAKVELEQWFQNNLLTYAEYLDYDVGFCGDRTIYSGTGIDLEYTQYSGYNRLVNTKIPTYICSNIEDLYTTNHSVYGNQALTYPVGLISTDEAMYAGGVYNISNPNYYLYTGETIWTMTPFQAHEGGAIVVNLYSTGLLGIPYVVNLYGIRPVINLKADTIIYGDGTKDNPYKLVIKPT